MAGYVGSRSTVKKCSTAHLYNMMCDSEHVETYRTKGFWQTRYWSMSK
jgi:hypothetical protein